MSQDIDQLTEVFEVAQRKFEKGAAKYGTFDPEADGRDFLQEAEAELLDAINYLAMFLVKVRTIRRTEQKRQAAGQKKRRIRNLKSGTMAGQIDQARKNRAKR